jgi:hypothetical protein
MYHVAKILIYSSPKNMLIYMFMLQNIQHRLSQMKSDLGPLNGHMQWKKRTGQMADMWFT